MVQDTLAVKEEHVKPQYPKGIPYIIGNEAAERFSFYGMRSILVTFLVAQFFIPQGFNQTVADAKANEISHIFVALAYAMPVVGALAADWFFGKFRVIFYVSIVYCIGHLMLALYDDNLTGFQIGLIIIAIGAGGIKSCVSANVGDQFDKSNQSLMSKVYGWFYFSINAGSVFANIAIPYINKHYGAKWAFGIPGILMALATIIFFLGRKKMIKMPPSGVNRNNFLFISVYSLFNIRKKKKGESLLDVAKQKFDPEKVEGIKAVWRVMAIFAFVPIFWAMWDQCLSEWVLQATKLEMLHLNLIFWNIEVLPEQVQTANPIFLLSFIPIFNYGIYPLLDKIGIKTTPLRRFGFGLFLTGVSFVIIALIQEKVDAGQHPSTWWQILAYMVLAAGETLVSITGLEYAYTQSPKSMKSTMSAIWLFTVALGNTFVAYVQNSISHKGFFSRYVGADFYWFFVVLLAAFLVVYLFVSPRIKERNYVTEDENKVAAETTNL
ncbi:POT-type proton-dependent oligopeptide transporter [Mucilaginibacter terrae]|uniref:POT family proton-dependent oligopeptide transporter n=1 Tax=Mucilaginibacter terrae TaxID=1955052 RepID=A0ABU3GRG7_9SPHI|nr:MFS transporter [Mucilaginibacter terrae]MDT3402375.1 POT family proton-dependent oligopeptide transporter [Mucilaginibacter terrae]